MDAEKTYPGTPESPERDPHLALGSPVAEASSRDYGRREDAFKGKRAYEDVYVAEWGKWFRVRGMNGVERDAYEQSITITERDGSERINVKNARPKLIVRCVVDLEDRLLFSESDVPELAKQPARAVQTLFDVARRLGGLSTEVLKEIEGNSDGDRNADSISG